MGRRSINTTKSGKYMNPTDQARKEARKQELKKNKKQRQMVRAAVLKGKDPQQLLDEMEKIDQMEFNVNQPSPLNEKVLKDKRKKLRDTLDRVLSMYYKDDPDKWADLKRKQTEYEHKRNQMVAFFESVRSAQQVTVEEIPLPSLPQQSPQAPSLQIPLPTENKKPEHTIYSIATALKLQALGKPIREPPGCPPGPPPEIDSDGEVIDFDFDEADEEMANKANNRDGSNDESSDKDSDDDSEEAPSSKKPTSLQQKMVALSGQNVDEFMKEMETVQKKMESEKEEENHPKPTAAAVHIESPAPPGIDPSPVALKPPPQNPPQVTTAPPPLLFPGPGLRVPPGPPPGRPLMPPGPPPGLPRLPLRMQPAPPRMIRMPGPPPSMSVQSNLPVGGNPNVLSAAPQLINRNEPMKQSATISAKPQIRNLSADVTRFVPSTLRVKREDKKPKPSRERLVHELRQKEYMAHIPPSQQPTKDDAYMQFMKEMQGLL